MDKLAEEQKTDDLETTDEITDTEEESQEDTTEVTDDSEDQEQEAEDTEDTGESEESADEYTEDEAEYVRQFDLPEDIDTIEKALKYAKDLKDGVLPDVKRGQTEAQKKLEAADAILRQAGYVNGIDDIVNGAQMPGQQQTTDGDFKWSFTSDMIKNKLAQGSLSQEDAAYLNSVAELIDPIVQQRDQMYQAGFRAVYQELQKLKGETTNLSSFTRNKEYADFVRLGKQQKFSVLEKDKLDAVMREIPKLDTYQKAQAYLIASNEKELAKVFSNINKGAETRMQKKFRHTGRFSVRSKKQATKSANYNQFLNPDGTLDQDKVLNHPDADKILDYYTKKK